MQCAMNMGIEVIPMIFKWKTINSKEYPTKNNMLLNVFKTEKNIHHCEYRNEFDEPDLWSGYAQ